MRHSAIAMMAAAMAMAGRDFNGPTSPPDPVLTGDGDDYRKARADKARREKAEAKRQRKAARLDAARRASQPERF
jgi:hypothetical protein